MDSRTYGATAMLLASNSTAARAAQFNSVQERQERQLRSSGSSSNSRSRSTDFEWSIFGQPHQGAPLAGLHLGFRGSKFFWSFGVDRSSRGSGSIANSSSEASIGSSHAAQFSNSFQPLAPYAADSADTGTVASTVELAATNSAADRDAGTASWPSATLVAGAAAAAAEQNTEETEESAAGAERARVSFGVVHPVITGFVLLLLGGCHSSCETLIYTVLTDLVTTGSDHPASSKDFTAAGGSNADCAAAALAQDATTGHSKSATAAAAVAAQPIRHGTLSQQCTDEHMHHLPVTVRHNEHGLGHLFDCTLVEQQLRVDGADTTDATEIVMVLYVLFWVVGFTVGAAVAGVPGSVLAQQLTGCVMGLLLAGSAWWSWRAAAGLLHRAMI